MKITRIEAIPVNVPLKPELRTKTSHGEHVTSPYVIVRVHTDSSHVGLGEATVAPRWTGETSVGCVAAINGLIAPALVGEDATRITSLTQKMNRVIKLNPFMKSGIEMALWDLAGKAAGVPVFQLLGGRVRESVPIKMVIGAFDIPQAVSLAERFLDEGVRCLKVKVGPDPEQDIERVRAVRERAGAEIPIGIDANCGWSVTQASQMLRRLAEFDILFAEQPIPVENRADMAALRRQSSIPIMADESVFTVHDAWQLTQAHAADILSVYPGKHGGIQATLEIANIAKAAGIVCSMGSNLELGIATAAMLHVGVAVPVIASELYPGDFIGPKYHEADLLKTPLTLGPSSALVPEGPGLGVELDEEQLEKYRDRTASAADLRASSAS
jgi:muconate cycloisomerase